MDSGVIAVDVMILRNNSNRGSASRIEMLQSVPSQSGVFSTLTWRVLSVLLTSDKTGREKEVTVGTFNRFALRCTCYRCSNRNRKKKQPGNGRLSELAVICRDDVSLQPLKLVHLCASIVQQLPLHPSSPSLAESIVLKEILTGCDTMENPHAERQAILLERIVKNAVRRAPHL